MTTPSADAGPLGWSVALPETAPGVDLGRDVTWTVGPGGRDLALTSGGDNLAQALAVALTTRLGDDVFNTGFGFNGIDALAQETNPVLTRERIRVAVIQTVLADPRVRRIVDVRLDAPTADGAPLQALRAGRELRIQVIFETVTFQQATIQVRAGGHG
jgi:phage baseplate assembly protein W